MSNNAFNEKIEKELKVILLGECGVGKTNIILRYIQDKFDEDSITTTGSSYIMKRIKKDNITYRLNIWDTAGQEKFRSVTRMFLQEANIIILVYSIVDQLSFEGLDYWYNTVIDNCGNDVVIGIAGNKYDLYTEEVISEEKAEKYAQEKNAVFKLVSAKSNKGSIDELFDMILDEYIKKSTGVRKNIKNSNIKINNKQKSEVKEKKNKCC